MTSFPLSNFLGSPTFWFLLPSFKKLSSHRNWCGSVDLSAGLWTKGSQVQLPIQAYAWVAGPGPQQGGTREATTRWCFSPSFSLSLPLRLKIRKENLFKKIPHSSIRENLVTGYVIWELSIRSAKQTKNRSTSCFLNFLSNTKAGILKKPSSVSTHMWVHVHMLH